MGAAKSTEELYVISYLLRSTEENQIVGYANLAARIYYLAEEIRTDEKISDTIAASLDDLVDETEDSMLKWDSLRSFIESARAQKMGSMFLTVESEEIGPNKWEYKFRSNAPESVLETKIENISERNKLLKQKIENTAEKNKKDLYETIF